MSSRLFSLSLLLSWTLAARAQQSPAPTAAQAAPKRHLTAVRLSAPIKLDGVLDEQAWAGAPVAGQFVERRPNPGQPEKNPTEVRVLYDDAALYVGATMHEQDARDIRRELTQRDKVGITDYFAIFLDPYRDHLNGYGFVVMSTGVQMDLRYSPAGGEDTSWNAVWDARVAQQGSSWTVEMRIPYSAIRFAAAEVQQWGLQFQRQRKKDNQQFFWNEVRPQVDGFVNQWGELDGLRGLQPPLRLSLTPYVSAYLNHYPAAGSEAAATSSSFNGGADLKWGINESFTLDATLVPDFGQTLSDNRVLNLTPFEVQYNENRAFFTEGTELFNKGNLFYSRRVGAAPMGYDAVDGQRRKREYVLRNPDVTRLLNATKLSGRTTHGLGVGVFNAVSNDTYATLRDSLSGQERNVLSQPLTNYNIVVLDQSLKNNSYLSFVNTNVTRAGATYDANVSGGLFRFANKANAYAVEGGVYYSRRRGLGFNSTAEVDDPDGYKYDLSLAKISGNFTWSVSQGIESDHYNPNDLGLLFSNNNLSQRVDFAYNRYQPFWKVNNLSTWWGLSQSSLYRPLRYQTAELFAGANTTFSRIFLTTGFNLNLNPERHDFFEPRTEPLGQYFVRVPASVNVGGFISSDYRKRLALDLNAGIREYAADGARTGRRGIGVGVSPRFRASNRLFFVYNLDLNWSRNQIGYVLGGTDSSYSEDQPFLDSILLGRRLVSTVVSTLQGSYTFTNRMSLAVRARHYTSNVHYRDFSTLGADGAETPADYRRNRDTSYNAFNVDATFSWWFAPGSQVSVVWKDAASTFAAAAAATPLYFDNLNGTLQAAHANNVSVKVLYYLDYLNLRRRTM